MRGFNFTELETGEEIVFGPVTTTTTTSVSGSSDAGEQSLSRTKGRTIGITTRRVIVEDLQRPEAAQVIPNADIGKVFIKSRQRKGQESISLVKAQTVNGQTVKLDMKGLSPQSKNVLDETFPNAEIVQSKGSGSKILLIAVILVGLVILVTCVLPLVASVIVRMFGG